MSSLRDDHHVPLWLHTPLLYSQSLSNNLDADVYLKLENVQTSQSFKFRGISLFAQRAKQKSPDTHLIIASGGNAGLAAACAAKAVGLKCSVYLPLGLNSKFLETLKEQGAEIIEEGVNYAAALKKAREAVAQDERSVGGGGLLAGIMVGCKNANWDDVLIGTFETIGSDCFYQSMSANRQKEKTGLTDTMNPKFTIFHDSEHDVELVRLNAITSVASSLGASSPAPGAVRMALDRKGPVKCALVPDLLSMQIAARFAEDHKFLVELACSTTLVPAYNKQIFDQIVPPAVVVGDDNNSSKKHRTIVFIVCGGTKISIKELARYGSTTVNNGESNFWEIFIDGEALQVNQ
ncbi:hypothetical protein Clacol_006669 [Clathrus columnatus]|uniref:L-serine ammonia-lyase n=1 Tax=Clathrus columnatus TaxID=1419009 RepID=A0AAV5AFB7_9AGAM|nr:hypothetical protein Clacol_006669 [Clathrus columnatus]